MQVAAPRIALDPFVEEGQSRLALAHFVEQVGADVRGMGAARKSGECRLDVAPPAIVHLQLDFRESKLGAEPPIVAVVRRQRLDEGQLLDLAAGATGEADQAEHAGRRRQRHRVARPGLHMLGDRRHGCGPLAGQDHVEDGDVASLALGRAAGKLARLGKRRLGLMAAAQHLLGPGERDMAERETLVGRHGPREAGVDLVAAREQPVDGIDIGVARRRLP